MEVCDTRATKESLGLYFGDNPDNAALDRAGKTQGFKTKQKIGFQVPNLEMPGTKLRPTSTMKGKDTSSQQRFGHVNARNRKSY